MYISIMAHDGSSEKVPDPSCYGVQPILDLLKIVKPDHVRCAQYRSPWMRVGESCNLGLQSSSFVRD